MNNWEIFSISVKKTTQLLLGLSLITNLAILALPLYSLQIFDRVLTSTSKETLWMLLIGVAIAGTCAVIFEHLRRSTLNDFCYFLEAKIFPSIIKSIQVKFDNSGKRELLYQYNYTIKQLGDHSIFSFIDGLIIPLFIAIAFLIHPVFGFFTLLFNGMFFITLMVKYKYVLPVMEESQLTRNEKQKQVLGNSSFIKWLSLTATYNEWFKEREAEWDNVLNETRNKHFLQALVANASQSIRWFAQVGVPTLGALLLLSGQITTGAFIAAIIVGARTFIPIENMINNLESLKKITRFFSSLRTVLEYQDEYKPGYKNRFEGYVSIKQLALIPLDKASDLTGCNFNLVANPGEINVVIGPSGSGQDVIISELLGYRSSGNGIVTFDNVRLEDWDRDTLYRSIGFVSLTTSLPHDSISRIITSFDQVNFSEALSAARKTGLNKMLIDCGIDYEQILKPGMLPGSMLRTVQQLIALTAAYSKNPQLYVLENPETHLDVQTLECLKELLNTEREKGKTLIITTQSRSLLNVCDNMILLNKGKIVYSGKRSEFLRIQKEREIGNTNKISSINSHVNSINLNNYMQTGTY